MGRPHRQDPHGGHHHITNHRAGSGDLWLSDSDRWLFVRLIEYAAARFEIRIVAFCLMGNHYHLMISCPSGGLSSFVHYVAFNYARAFNARHSRKGPLFVARFHNELIQREGQYEFTTRYIHRNALELGLDIATYPWSSFPAYCGLDAPTVGQVTLDVAPSLQLAGGRDRYREWVTKDMAHDKLTRRMGSRAIVASEMPDFEALLINLCDIVGNYEGTPAADFQRSQRGRLSTGRLAAVLIAHDDGVALSHELQVFFGFATPNGLRSALHRANVRHRTDPKFRSLVEAAQRAWSELVLRAA